MTHRLATNYAKNYCNRTPIVKVIAENVVTCFLGGHSVVSYSTCKAVLNRLKAVKDWSTVSYSSQVWSQQ